ncbi:MAG: hypothetical protein KatS3mg103_0774 [Phycisphaerales bacterium]|nr:MAG: hypothetical protein KatS3mg103_0774 [Phycisphaerales bacterium]
MFGGQTIGSRSVRNELKSLADNDLVKGVVLRIDSPGGSATASEIIWQGVRDLAQRKPVWVSVGSMAASGGYYIAVAGQKIYANPSSILGSIGVVGGKISMDGLYDTLRVGVVGRARGPHADMFATHKPWNDQQIELVRQKMRQTYEQFTGRVRQGRPGIDLSTTAEGRLFLGRAAVERKMADRVGSLHDAVADMAQQLGLEQYDVRHYPGPKSLAEFLEDAFGSMVSARAPAGGRGALAGALGRALPRSDGAGLMGLPMVQLLREAMGPQAFGQVAGALEALGQLRHEPVVLTAPSVLTVRSPR